MAVIATPSPTANSYASNAEAIAIWQADFRKSDWPTNEADQDKLLKGATALLDDIYGEQYPGELEDSANLLYWPRKDVTDPRTGDKITDFTVYPEFMRRATALQAYHMFKTDRDTEAADQVNANIRESLDGVGSVTRADITQQRQANYRSTIHPEVARVLASILSGGVSGYTSVLYRG